MFYVYVFATVMGALLLAVSLFGGDHDGDGDGGGGGGHNHDHDQDGDSGALGFFLSIRLWTYVLAFGGVTGLLLRLAAAGHEPTTALVAAGVGLAAGVLGRTLFRKASKPAPPSTVRPDDLVGKSARVLLPVRRGQTGQVRVLVRNADIDVLATTEDDGELARQDEVLIVEMRDGTALVTRNPAGAET